MIAVAVADALRWLLSTEGEGTEVALEKWPVLGNASDE